MSSLDGYLMPNPVYVYIHYIWFFSEYFVGNFIIKWARAHLFAYSWIFSSIVIYCLHRVRWFQVLLFNTNNYIQY